MSEELQKYHKNLLPDSGIKIYNVTLEKEFGDTCDITTLKFQIKRIKVREFKEYINKITNIPGVRIDYICFMCPLDIINSDISIVHIKELSSREINERQSRGKSPLEKEF